MASGPGSSLTSTRGHFTPTPIDWSWAPELYEHPVGTQRHIRIICIGAGFSGLCAAVHFQDHLQNFELQLYEKAEDVGGVWQNNKYPGVGCDVPSHSYQYSFCENTKWSAYYAPGSEIQNYLSKVAEQYNLRQYIKFRHTVERCEWDPKNSKWIVTLHDAATDKTFTDSADYVVHATGLLSHPVWPTNIPGRDVFKGTMVHSGEWPKELNEDFDWSNKRVGVIGVGASAVQMVPHLQKKCAQVLNFGKSKIWLSGGWGSRVLEKLQSKGDHGYNYYFTEEDHAEFEDEDRYRNFRCEIEWDLASTHQMILRDHPLQKVFAAEFSKQMRNRTSKKPHIAETLIPDFPVGCRRVSPAPGYLEALCADNCDLISEGIECFTEKGIRTKDGEEHELDIIVCATGFDVSFRPAYPIIGLKGVNMQDVWAKEARTYLGMFAAELPNSINLLTTQASVGAGSLLVVLEQQCAYITKLISKCQRDGYATFAPKQQSVDDFLTYADDYFARSVLTTNCKSWYKNGADGHSVVRTIWPGTGAHSFVSLQHPRWEDFDWTQRDLPGVKHTMSWLGNGLADHMLDGAYVHLAMRDFYKTPSLL